MNECAIVGRVSPGYKSLANVKNGSGFFWKKPISNIASWMVYLLVGNSHFAEDEICIIQDVVDQTLPDWHRVLYEDYGNRVLYKPNISH